MKANKYGSALDETVNLQNLTKMKFWNDEISIRTKILRDKIN